MTPETDVELKYPAPIVSAIVERERDGETEILVQTRWKPRRDPKYSGTLEIPAGTLEKYENVYQALEREVFEETGLRVTSLKPEIRTRVFSQKGDDSFAFKPFCCYQQTQGKSRVGFVFICTVEDRDPVPSARSVRDVRWMKRSQLRKMLEETPEEIFTFHLGALEYYMNCQEHQT